jgi:hypothetical protein
MKVVSTESRERGSILEKESDARQLTDRDWRQATVQWLTLTGLKGLAV